MILKLFKAPICSKQTRILFLKVRLFLVIIKIMAILPGFLFIFYCDSIMAQEIDLELLLDNDTEEGEASELAEYLYSILEHPLDLNKVKVSDLQTIPWITQTLAERMIAYRTKHDKYISTDQLLLIKGMDQDTFNIIKHFFCVAKKMEMPIQFQHRQRIMTTLEKSSGYIQKVYQGSRLKNYNRTLMGFKDYLSTGVLFEKDAGEQKFNDFAAGFFKLGINKINTQIILGNYKLEIGQGLNFWGSYGMGKNSNAIAPAKKRETGIKEYTSVNENASLSGMAISTQIKGLKFINCFSNSLIDANCIDQNHISSLYLTGYHRTEAEKNKKDIVREKVFGSHLQITLNKLALFGFTLKKVLMHPAVPATTTNNKNHVLTDLNTASANVDVHFGCINLFGEVAGNRPEVQALYSGMIVEMASLNYTFSLRYYKPDFFSPHSFAFGEGNGSGQNEIGIYNGLSGRISSLTRFSVYFDQFKQPWPSISNHLPVQGWDSIGIIEHKFVHDFKILAQFHIKNKEKSIKSFDIFGREQYNHITHQRITARLQLNNTIIDNIDLKTRFEKVWINWHRLGKTTPPSSNHGTLLFQDIGYRGSKYFSVNSRFTFFDTDSYESRVYQYESGVPGLGLSEVMYGRGTRFYLVIRYKPFLWLSTCAKYSCTTFDDRDSYGSGWDFVESSNNQQLGLQLDWIFK